MTAKPAPKRTRTETLSQARTWDGNVNRYRALGFCDRCAAQAAWGHQIGFTSTAPVGDCCRHRVLPERAGERAQRWVSAEPILTEAARLAREAAAACDSRGWTW